MSKRILVVEDNNDNLILIGEILRAFGYTYLIARDGVEAVEMVMRERPDLILMDLSLPRMDGWQASRHIKANPDLNAIPIIALTAHAMRGDREKAIEAGCDDYITKPINFSALIEKLKHYLGTGN